MVRERDQHNAVIEGNVMMGGKSIDIFMGYRGIGI
jgi:hypothetical protein